MRDRILIAGAGIGGLSAAIAVRQAGFAVTVIERAAAFSQSAGAGLTITAPGLASFEALGLGAQVIAMSDAAPATPMLHYQTGDVFHTRAVPNIADGSLPAPDSFVPRVTHRADVHQMLLETAIAQGVEVLTDAHLVDFAQDDRGVLVTLADGRHIDGSVLIGADGLRSRVRALLRGDEAPNHTGVVAWRALVPAALVNDLLGGHAIAIHYGPTAHFMRYLVRHGTMLNCVGIVKTDAHVQDGWATSSTNAELAGELQGWHRGLLDLVDRIPDGALFKWPLLDRDPIDRWVHGRTALLGDAAHAMLPFYGFGATIAMEDGIVLGRAMKAAADPVAALQMYERARIERANTALLASRELGKVTMGGDVLELITKPMMDWGLYAYDPRTAPLA